MRRVLERVRIAGGREPGMLASDDLDEHLAVISTPLLPSQLSGSGGTTAPALRLMAAVLDQAVQDFRTCAGAGDGAGRRLFKSVSEWFASDDTEAFYSFLNVCLALSMDPEAVRARLRSVRLAGVCTQTRWRRVMGQPTGATRIMYASPSRNRQPLARSGRA